MLCAYINLATGEITNIIIADPAIDHVADGFKIVSIEDTPQIDRDYLWSEDQGGFYLPADEGGGS